MIDNPNDIAERRDEEDDRDDHLFEPVAPKTHFEHLRERSRPLAWIWAFAEICRLSFAVLMFCGPPAILIFFVVDVVRHAFATWQTVFLARQFYISLFVSWLIPYLLYRLAHLATAAVLRTLRVTDGATV